MSAQSVGLFFLIVFAFIGIAASVDWCITAMERWRERRAFRPDPRVIRSVYKMYSISSDGQTNGGKSWAKDVLIDHDPCPRGCHGRGTRYGCKVCGRRLPS